MMQSTLFSTMPIPKVEVYEKVNQERKRVEYEMKIYIPSVPKFYFANSLQELGPTDRYPVFERLSRRLKDVGVMVTSHTISEAPLSVVHLAKNIPLSPELQMRTILNVLGKVDVGKAYDTTDDVRIKETNNGRVLHIYCGSREWAFYDKIEDMQRPSNKNSGGWNTPFEKEMVELYGLGNLEVFRYEYRLKKSQTIRSEMNAILGREYTTPVIFADLFSEHLWKTTLQQSWRRITDRPENRMAFLGFDTADRKRNAWRHIHATAEKADKGAHSQNNALKAWGLATGIIEFGAKAVRHDLGRIWSSRSDDCLDEKIRAAAKLIEGAPVSDGIIYITDALERFERLTSESLTRIAGAKTHFV